MKKHTYIILAALILQSCSLDRTPFDSRTEDELFAGEGSAEVATLGNYARLKPWTEQWHRLMEYPGDNVALSGTTSDALFFVYNYQRNPNNGRVLGFWQRSYETIVGANKVIERITEGSSDTNDQLLAENYYLRAMVHFYLVNVFGKPYNQGVDNPGVPIKLDSDISNRPLRSTVGAVYTQVEQDLTKAIGLFKTVKNNNFASKEAAQALLARLYLYQERDELAFDFAEEVINSGRFSLLATLDFPEYPNVVPETNSETIFAVRFLKDTDYPGNGWSTIGSLYANFLGSGWGEMYASRRILEMLRTYPEDMRNRFIEPKVIGANLKGSYVKDDLTYGFLDLTKSGTDYTYSGGTLEKESNGAGSFLYYAQIDGKRRSILIDSEMELRNGYPKYYIIKCSGQEGQGHLWSPVISRLAEMYLIKAEVYAKAGEGQLALDEVNRIRTRAGIPSAGLYTLANLGGKSVLDIVMEERQLELAYEGHRKMDVFRNKRDMDRNYPGTHLLGTTPKHLIEYTSNDAVEYIPESQILIQPELSQNP